MKYKHESWAIKLKDGRLYTGTLMNGTRRPMPVVHFTKKSIAARANELGGKPVKVLVTVEEKP